MDFRGRGNQGASPAQVNRPAAPSSGSFGSQLSGVSQRPVRRMFQLATVGLLFSLTALVVALTFLLAIGGNSASHAIQKDKYQAVFLNNGQVYFGSIRSINSKSIDLRSIYYLQTNGTNTDTTQTQTAGNVSLVKLGCELHAPYDQMLINNDQVIFWENLQDSSQVVTAIKKYISDNKGKTVCSQQSQQSTQQAPSTSTTTPSPAATGTTTKKP